MLNNIFYFFILYNVISSHNNKLTECLSSSTKLHSLDTKKTETLLGGLIPRTKRAIILMPNDSPNVQRYTEKAYTPAKSQTIIDLTLGFRHR